MYIYIICPVRFVTPKQYRDINKYVAKLENEHNLVFLPYRDVIQTLPELEIVKAELIAIQNSDRVDVFWDITSSGSHFDLGIAVALKKRIKLIKNYNTKMKGHGYLKIIEQINDKENPFD